MSAAHDTAAVLTEVSDDPPGIDPSTHDMPTPGDAAERVNAFVAWFGDGRVFVDPDESTAPPLYARDLETLTRLVTRARLAAQPPQDDAIPGPADPARLALCDCDSMGGRFGAHRAACPAVQPSQDDPQPDELTDLLRGFLDSLDGYVDTFHGDYRAGAKAVAVYADIALRTALAEPTAEALP